MRVPEQRAHMGGGGLGIGLVLSRRLAELHGGTLEAASGGLGSGSEFTLRLPLVEAAAVESTPSARLGREQSSAQRVLIVDDSMDAADTLRLVLDLQGHATEVAYDATNAGWR